MNKDAKLVIRLSKGEKNKLRISAKRNNKSMSQVIRDFIDSIKG